MHIRTLLLTPPISTYLIIVFSFFGSNLTGQKGKCIPVKEYTEVSTMQNLLRTHQLQKAQILGDSILADLKSKNQLDCEVAYWIYLIQGEHYELTQQVHLAVELYHKVSPAATKNKWYELLAETYISLARSHEARGRASDCKRNLNEAEYLINKHKIERSRSRLCLRSSSYYRMYGNRPDTAMILAHDAVRLGKINNRPRSETDGYMLLGMLESDKTKRIEYYIKGRDVFLRTKVYHGAAIMNSSLAGIYREQGKYKKALKTISYSAQLENMHVEYTGMLEPTHFYQMHIIYGIKSQIFSELGMQDSVEYFSGLSQDFLAKVRHDHDEEKISQLEIQTAVENEKIKAQGLLEQLKKTKIGIGVSLGFLTLLGLLLLIILKNRKELKVKNKLISDQVAELSSLNKKQGILLSEVHHRVKNNLQNIISLLSFHKQNINDPKTRKKIDDVANKIFSIALIHEQLYQDDNFENVDLFNYFTLLTNRYESLNNAENGLEININTNDIRLNIETATPLGLICSELITNSIKYASMDNKLMIEIKMTILKDNKYLFHYKDNGSGYSEKVLNNKTSGLGMMLIRSMSRQLLGDLHLSNDNGANTELTFEEKVVSTI